MAIKTNALQSQSKGRLIVVQNYKECPYYARTDEEMDCDICYHPDKAGEIEDVEADGFCAGCPL